MMKLQRYNPGLEQPDYRFHDVPKPLQTKGNQEIHQELQVKADELDKLFAAHKLQAQSSRRTSLVEKQRVHVELNPNMNIVELGRLNSERGRLYDRYMQIREVKLRGRWDSVRVFNDEKIKVMGEKLEHIRDVMKFSSAEYFDQQELVMQSGRARLGSLRSSSMHLIGNSSREKQLVKLQDEYDSTRSLKSKSFTHNRRLSSPIPRSSAPPIPRSSSKGSSTGRRRIAPENVGEHSLPNSPDFDEPNTRQPQDFSNEITNRRLQFSHVPRSKSINGQKPATQKGDTWRSRSTRKSTLSYNESRDSSSSGQNSGDAKPFLRKGSGIGPGARPRIAKPKAEIESNSASSSEEESTEMITKREDSVSVIGNAAGTRNIPTDFYNDNSISKQESERSAVLDEDDIVILKLNARVERNLVSVPLTLPTPLRQLQESPVQSPVSWTARMHSPFSSSPKRSDTNISIESQISWNSKSVTELETDSPRARKKWGDVKKEARSFFSLSTFRSKGSNLKHK